MLESLDDVNIKDLIIENPKYQDRLLFDPKRDISRRIWEELGGEFLIKSTGIHEHSIIDELAALKLLFPESSYKFRFTKDQTKRVISVLSERSGQGDWGLFGLEAASLRILTPEVINTRARFRVPLNDSHLSKIREHIEETRKEGQYPYPAANEIVYCAYGVRMLLPEKFDQIGVIEEDLVAAQKSLEDSLKKKDWMEYLHLAMPFRIAFPEKFLEQKLNLREVQGLLDFVSDFEDAELTLAEVVWGLHVLFAHEVVPTKTGLKIIQFPPEKDPEVDLKPEFDLPVRRAF